MKYDIVLCGVGGQGVLSMAAVIGLAAAGEGRRAKQSEVHGMAQRGSTVHAHLRLSEHVIESDLIALGGADLLLSMEPLESLRYLDWLSPRGAVVTAAEPVVNMPGYPPIDEVLARIRALPRAIVVEAERLAREAGDAQAVNTVIVGAAAHLLPVGTASLEKALEQIFTRKGEDVLRMNLAAFRAGQAAALASKFAPAAR
jgi:indolepyruvate ferredoxin oxidoreductase beta subunit